jgi:hypothetical protein
VKAEEAICCGQRRIRKVLWRIGATLEGYDAGSAVNGAG